MVDEGLFFLDSGAHSLYTREVIAKGHRDGYAFYDTPEFWAYVDDYARFVKQHLDVIDYYANVDVIFDPERSWNVLKYLEGEHGLSPLPVIHYGTPLRWLERHLDAGYEYIGLGGLGQEATAGAYRRWADEVFRMICPQPSRLPTVRTHGFAMTAYDLLIRYPWWSVDSATWTKVGAFGSIIVPQYRDGKFVFTEPPYIVAMSDDSPQAKVSQKHYKTLRGKERDIVDLWIKEIGLELGTPGSDDPEHRGLCNHHAKRKLANLMFFQRLIAALPEYPWPFRPSTQKRGVGLSI